ncbi:hypothetical protein [Levilactobacillus tongjiangensis]|uniref:Uncharacterized protein n=1 Tax=Levilactobacillus tongjiangensis TaxID=2486023 RepID=A0ABW1SQE3_9LACO|nr:hypothetical protein [Levilactobacillus tongjiangensis]
MKKVFGYVLGLVAALTLAGGIATTANADGSSADAASGSGSGSAPASAIVPSGPSDTIAPAAGMSSSSSSSASSSSSSSAANSSSAVDSSSTASSSSSSATQKPQKPEKPAKKPAKEKEMSAAKKMRGRLHYKKDSRVILFQKVRKGAEVTLRNREGKFVKKFRVKKNGKFEVRLTAKEAKELNKGGKYFKFTVVEKGYKAYTIHYLIKK